MWQMQKQTDNGRWKPEQVFPTGRHAMTRWVGLLQSLGDAPCSEPLRLVDGQGEVVDEISTEGEQCGGGRCR